MAPILGSSCPPVSRAHSGRKYQLAIDLTAGSRLTLKYIQNLRDDCRSDSAVDNILWHMLQLRVTDAREDTQFSQVCLLERENTVGGSQRFPSIEPCVSMTMPSPACVLSKTLYRKRQESPHFFQSPWLSFHSCQH